MTRSTRPAFIFGIIIFLVVGGFVEVFIAKILQCFSGTVKRREGVEKCPKVKFLLPDLRLLRRNLLSQQKSFELLDRRPNCGKVMHEFSRKASQPHIRFKFNCFLLSFHLSLSFRVKKNGVKSCHKAEHFTLHTRDSFYRIMRLEAARVKQTWFCIAVHHRFVL